MKVKITAPCPVSILKDRTQPDMGAAGGPGLAPAPLPSMLRTPSVTEIPGKN